MSNKRYKKCFCVEEVDETNNPNSDDIENVGIDESLLRIDDDDDDNDEELMRRLAKLKEPTSSDASNAENNNTLVDLPVNTNIPPPSTGEQQNYLQGGYKRTKSKGEHLIRSYSYKSKKGGKRRTVKHNKNRKTVKHNKKRKTVKHNKKRKTVKHNKKRKTNKKHTMKKKKFNKK